MLTIDVPGYRELKIRHLVLDYNGTLAFDGRLLDGVPELISALSKRIEIHVVTADTFGRAQKQLENLPCKLSILPEGGQDIAKEDYVRRLGLHNVASIGNGRNDRLMLKEAALGIFLVQEEGAAVESLMSADIVCLNIVDALSLFTNPKRLIATLRS